MKLQLLFLRLFCLSLSLLILNNYMPICINVLHTKKLHNRLGNRYDERMNTEVFKRLNKGSFSPIMVIKDLMSETLKDNK